MVPGPFNQVVSPIRAPYIEDDDVADIFRNATITDPSNTVTAKFLATTNGTTPDVNVSTGAPPVVGQTLIATSATAATWQTLGSQPTTFTNATITDPSNTVTAKFLATTGGATPDVDVSTTAPPTAGNVLVATSSTAATWQLTAPTASNANALNTTTLPVDVAASPAPSVGQILVATSGTTATWQTPVSSSLGHGFFYGTAGLFGIPDYPVPVLPGFPFPIPTTDYTTGSVSAVRPDPNTVSVTASGRYAIDFVTSCDEPGQIAVCVSSFPAPYTIVAQSRVGRATGTSQMVISTSLNLNINDTIQVWNDGAGPLTVTGNAGGPGAVATTFRITQLA